MYCSSICILLCVALLVMPATASVECEQQGFLSNVDCSVCTRLYDVCNGCDMLYTTGHQVTSVGVGVHGVLHCIQERGMYILLL